MLLAELGPEMGLTLDLQPIAMSVGGREIDPKHFGYVTEPRTLKMGTNSNDAAC